MKKYILALDAGTTSVRAILFDKFGRVFSVSQKEFTQFYPQQGWVEHDAVEIFECVKETMLEVVNKSKVDPQEIAGIGITNQRETTVVWEKSTGMPIARAIVWQCRRTADMCEKLIADGLEEYIGKTTGLKIDAYFSATKIKWILDNIKDARTKAECGELLFGTIDTWLLWKLTNWKFHITDRTNASRTMLFDINNLCWDKKLMSILNIPTSMMPKVCSSSEIYAYTDILGCDIPIAGIAGDQQAALFGQACWDVGSAKNTYGTGCFMLMNCGTKPVFSDNGLVTTIAATLQEEPIQYALEGSVFVGGAVIQWIRDELGLIASSAESETVAKQVKSCEGIYMVPAFTGLGAPYWDMYARGIIVGLTRGSGKAHIVRAALESIAYQVNDVLEVMTECTEIKIKQLHVDGGASENALLMQFQADISDIEIDRAEISESTALGAAFLAGLAVKFWENKDEIRAFCSNGKTYTPQIANDERQILIKGWKKAVSRSKSWTNEVTDK